MVQGVGVQDLGWLEGGPALLRGLSVSLLLLLPLLLIFL